MRLGEEELDEWGEGRTTDILGWYLSGVVCVGIGIGGLPFGLLLQHSKKEEKKEKKGK